MSPIRVIFGQKFNYLAQFYVEICANCVSSVVLSSLQVKCRLLNYDIYLNEFLTYFWKCWNLINDIFKKMSEIHSKICRNLKANIWLELDHIQHKCHVQYIHYIYIIYITYMIHHIQYYLLTLFKVIIYNSSFPDQT